ncbi:sigma-E factor negative regulatory protein [Actinobacillus equuli subsp. equuli]|uniref:Anti-sigma-E factor RseA n=1 Tax=Actinobacillus equuli subsp. equuli TaxID=202947 RepID=A0A9X4G3L7_ACTEU|nr:sigma-E factor negative regulatory protein [Actinobacillus equuli]MDE8033670.1 sigma-E factor negative regulatory protein [Actinobacillus equuli subsp. equuli]MDG4948259.1 sigma-E factor negative regulatory protein [Actinobacillus equuli subsp. haemolyticus]WGE51803.1 sigma-E factor negative regulatory protein [Actinobacillus equuli subsp. haemolyticus]
MQQRETLSAFMDGHDVDEEFINELCNNPELKQKWASYHAISSVMHGDEIILGDDFSAKMEALLENEEIESSSLAVADEQPQPKGMLLKLKRWGTPLMQAGIAASVCLVAVLGVNMVGTDNDIAQADQPVLQTQPFSDSVQPVSYNAPEKDAPTAAQLEQQQNKINSLLNANELQHRSKSEEQKAQAESTENSGMQKIN